MTPQPRPLPRFVTRQLHDQSYARPGDDTMPREELESLVAQLRYNLAHMDEKYATLQLEKQSLADHARALLDERASLWNERATLLAALEAYPRRRRESRSIWGTAARLRSHPSPRSRPHCRRTRPRCARRSPDKGRCPPMAPTAASLETVARRGWAMTSPEQWREAANVLREQAIKFDRYAEIAQTTEDLRTCGLVSNSGPNGEPLGCGYQNHHSGPHSWATLPTFTQGRS